MPGSVIIPRPVAHQADARHSASADTLPAGANEVDRVIAILAKVDTDLQMLTSSGIDTIISPANQALFLLSGAQEALRRSEERYRFAMRATGCVIWDWDVTKGEVTWAGPLEDIFGDRAEDIGSTPEWWKQRVHPEDYQRVVDHFYCARKQRLASDERQREKPWGVEYRFRKADGSYIQVEGVHFLCSVSGGKATRIVGSITDITKRKIDEERLRRSEAHLTRAQRLTSLGSFEYDGASETLRLSDEAYRVFGVAPESFTNSVDAIRALIHPADLDGVIGLRQLIGAQDAGLATTPSDFRVVSPNGDVRIIRRECDPVIDATGRVTGFFGTFQDITKIRVAEEQRRELELQLLQAQKMESLGTLAGGIAHDLNNTLVPVINLAELIRRKLPEECADRLLLDVIRQSGERARDLVRQILTFSRRRAPDRQELDLEAFLRQSMRLIRASVLTNIVINEQFQAVPRVLADPSQLDQVIVNLVTNAAHAIGAAIGTITIELTIEQRPLKFQAGRSLCDWIRLSVTDTGCGIDDRIIRRIFDPFFTTKEVGQGNGLGLSVVHGIIAAHGGHIEVKSWPGGGTRFDIFLPGIAA
jgi:PAS domain S-box-containing protein